MSGKLAFRALHNPGVPIALRFGELEILAFAISGLASYVMVPRFNACFDLGHCAFEAASLDHVFLSHVHQDHSLGVFRHHALRTMFGNAPAKVYVPIESLDALRDTFLALARLEERSHDEAACPQLVGVRAGDRIRLDSKREVLVFDAVHRIASRAYAVIETRREYLPEWANATRDERRDARVRGIEIATSHTANALTYVGDSTLATLEAHPEVGESEVLFIEATHFAPSPHASSAKWGHTHLDELIALMKRSPATFASQHIVLKHFSTRYHSRQIRAALEAIPDGIRERVVALIPSKS